MSTTLFTPLVDNTSLLDASTLNGVTGALDSYLSKHAGALCWATTEQPITQNGTTVKFGDIHIFHYSISGGDLGKLIRQKLAAATLALSNGNAMVVTVSESDASTLGAASAVDVDALPTTLKDPTKVVLLVRSPEASGTGLLHYVALRPAALLRGTGSITASAGTTTITFPTGYTLPSNEYSVLLFPTAQGFFAKDPAITTKNAGSFVITHVNAAGAVAFDYVVVPN